MDGTFFLGNKLLPGALELLDFLNRKGTPYRFLTNNSSKSQAEYIEKLVGLGVDRSDANIVTSGDATIQYLLKNFDTTRIFLIGTPGLEEAFSLQGFKLVDKNPDLVVLGFDTTLTYEKLRKLCQFVAAGLPFIATHPDINCPTPTGFIPDIGSMLALVKASTGREPDIIIGKPNPIMLDMLEEKMSLKAEELAMVGDRLYTDIALGQTAGVTTVLVLSGETKREDLEESPFKPDYVFEGLPELLKALNSDSSKLKVES